ncbi:unnamed protein product [Prorocentrum cordatum]|uniref:methylmalonate-semialdehyde dehydrogenase (CoA acylating) n=1 Tax=Prorocentrum cordatum TaxID=2364126 RepID=A0ABN9S7A1_9DINO|nr:unnamed protein product [Polarella glacialis]
MVPFWTVPIAIGCGNAVILKPSEKVPLTMTFLAKLFKQAGVPDGIFQIVHGVKPTVDALIEHPTVKAVSFVGTSRVAKLVADKARALNKRALCLGGAKNHLCVLPDANYDMCTTDIMNSFAGSTGQRCMAASVCVLVGPEEKFKLFMELLVKKASALEAGQEPGQVGPVIDQASKDKILRYISEAESRDGAQVLVDGRAWATARPKGFWVGPTILRHGSPQNAACREEIFGPVLSMSPSREITNADLLKYMKGMDRNVNTKLKKVHNDLRAVDKKADAAVEAAQSAQKMAAAEGKGRRFKIVFPQREIRLPDEMGQRKQVAYINAMGLPTLTLANFNAELQQSDLKDDETFQQRVEQSKQDFKAVLSNLRAGGWGKKASGTSGRLALRDPEKEDRSITNPSEIVDAGQKYYSKQFSESRSNLLNIPSWIYGKFKIDKIHDIAPWQFAYREGHSVMDMGSLGYARPMLRVDTFDEAIAIENSNPYGNAACIYTSVGQHSEYFLKRVSAAMLGVNIGVPVPREPFSFGGMNDSSFAASDITGDGAMEFFTQRKKITQKWVPPQDQSVITSSFIS